MSNEKNIISELEIDSNQLLEKAKISLEKVGFFSLSFKRFDEYNESSLENLNKVLLLDTDFFKCHCNACGGTFYIFKSPNIQIDEKNNTGLCFGCMKILIFLTCYEADNDKVVEWMKSEGKINPLEILREEIKNR